MLMNFILITFYLQFVTTQKKQQALYNSPCDKIIKLVSNNESKQQLNQTLNNLIEYPHSCALNLHPIYRWAQNMTHIIVGIDFQTNIHSGCDKVLQTKQIQTHKGFTLTTLCIYSQKILRYHIHIITFKSLNFYHFRWIPQSHNKMVFQCLKSPSPYFWNLLYSRKNVPVQKPKIWWQIMNKYEDQLAQFLSQLQSDQQDQIAMKKITNKKIQYSCSQSLQFYCNKGDPIYLGSWL